jgi:hypothetical protein
VSPWKAEGQGQWLSPEDDPEAKRGIPVFRPTMEEFKVRYDPSVPDLKLINRISKATSRKQYLGVNTLESPRSFLPPSGPMPFLQYPKKHSATSRSRAQFNKRCSADLVYSE